MAFPNTRHRPGGLQAARIIPPDRFQGVAPPARILGRFLEVLLCRSNMRSLLLREESFLQRRRHHRRPRGNFLRNSLPGRVPSVASIGPVLHWLHSFTHSFHLKDLLLKRKSLPAWLPAAVLRGCSSASPADRKGNPTSHFSLLSFSLFLLPSEAPLAPA